MITDVNRVYNKFNTTRKDVKELPVTASFFVLRLGLEDGNLKEPVYVGIRGDKDVKDID
jgi:hypothetical protein